MLALHGAVAVAIWATHRRVPPARLYNSRRGGASRAVVFANYPTSVAAVSLLPRGRRRRLAAAALPLLGTVALPGMVDERHLDARRRNVLPLLGVVLAVAAGEEESKGSFSRPLSHTALGTALLVVSIPWVLADLGLQTRGMRTPSPAEPGVDRVHLGHHEGLDGVLLAVDGLIVEPYARGHLHRWYVALMVSYGCAVAAKDAWHEQVAKRGWTTRHLPDVIRPRPTRSWAVLLAVTPLVERLLRSARNRGV